MQISLAKSSHFCHFPLYPDGSQSWLAQLVTDSWASVDTPRNHPCQWPTPSTAPPCHLSQNLRMQKGSQRSQAQSQTETPAPHLPVSTLLSSWLATLSHCPSLWSNPSQSFRKKLSPKEMSPSPTQTERSSSLVHSTAWRAVVDRHVAGLIYLRWEAPNRDDFKLPSTQGTLHSNGHTVPFLLCL